MVNRILSSKHFSPQVKILNYSNRIYLIDHSKVCRGKMIVHHRWFFSSTPTSEITKRLGQISW